MATKMTPEQYIAVQLHLMFCEEEHTYDIRLLVGSHYVEECLWYLESQIDPTWEQPVHAKYLGLAERAIKFIRSELENEEDIIDAVTSE